MKKLIIAIAVVGFVVSFSSCKKDYTCDCTYASQTISAEIKDSKKGDAEDTCDALEATYKLGDPSASCELK